MIAQETFTVEWIEALRIRLGRRVDPKMIEKVIYALALLEQLASEGLNFIFKGGTCLLLTSKDPKRFSIDIDIIIEQSRDEISAVLEEVVKRGGFTRWEPDNDRKAAPDAPVSHYKVYYASVVDNNFGEEPILLDVLHAPNPYPKVIEHPIEHSWLKQEGEIVSVKVPVYDCILGDKLTAFAPKTTGILYTKGRPVEIIKQLYDIGFLFDNIEHLELVRESYLQVVKEEIAYRKLDVSYAQVLDDTIEACLTLASRSDTNPDFIQLRTGVNNITNFIITRFKIEEAVIAAGKIAYLCLLIKQNGLVNPEHYKGPDQIMGAQITNTEYQWLNRLKKSNPVAFFYWEKAIAIKP